MAKLTSILSERFLKKEKSKTQVLAEQAGQGALTSFKGIFGDAKMSEHEKETLSSLLKKFAPSETIDSSHDLQDLLALGSEVKAIANQAVMLHGMRIKRAQEILKKYKEGAFTAWLLLTYGNRQTPYNFLQYYEFYQQVPSTLHTVLETMPRQAIYTLASREGDLEKKQEIIHNYKGETKEELLRAIRARFPLAEDDRRKEDVGENAIQSLKRLLQTFETTHVRLSPLQKKTMSELLQQLSKVI